MYGFRGNASTIAAGFGYTSRSYERQRVLLRELIAQFTYHSFSNKIVLIFNHIIQCEMLKFRENVSPSIAMSSWLDKQAILLVVFERSCSLRHFAPLSRIEHLVTPAHLTWICIETYIPPMTEMCAISWHKAVSIRSFFPAHFTYE